MSIVAPPIFRPQIKLIEKKVKTYNRNYRYFLKILSKSPFLYIPKRDPRERISPDSIQFSIKGINTKQAKKFMEKVNALGLHLNVFGVHKDNARVFWNWKFLGRIPRLPKTKDVVFRSCDMRLPVFFREKHLDYASNTIVKVLDEILKKH